MKSRTRVQPKIEEKVTTVEDPDGYGEPEEKVEQVHVRHCKDSLKSDCFQLVFDEVPRKPKPTYKEPQCPTIDDFGDTELETAEEALITATNEWLSECAELVRKRDACRRRILNAGHRRDRIKHRNTGLKLRGAFGRIKA